MPLMRALEQPDLPAETRGQLLAMREAIEAGAADRLIALLEGETDVFARDAAMTCLARQRDDFAIDALVRLLQVENVALRNDAIEILGLLGERAIDRIEPLLDDPDPNRRIYALTALEGTESYRAAAMALRVALRDPHVNVCASAVDVVARCGAAEMGAALKAVRMRFPEAPYLAFAVRAALQKIG